jgi:predicted SAM-dependent methyltransferase
MNIWANLVGKVKRRLISFLPPDILIRIAVHKHGDKVFDALSDGQKMAVLEQLCETRLADVITAINSKPDVSFKYIGKEDVKIIIGAGPQKMEGWLATDIDQLNIVEESSWRRLFNPGSIDRVLAEHVLEHLSLRELRDTLGNVHKYLKPGGLLRLAVPDAFHPSRYYYNLVKPGGWETPYEHMLFLDYEMLSRIASELGFEVRLLEYFDENGVFHSEDYDSKDGIIRRCARHNVGLDTNDREVMTRFHASIPEHLREQFVERRMTYTSLIVDLIKHR